MASVDPAITSVVSRKENGADGSGWMLAVPTAGGFSADPYISLALTMTNLNIGDPGIFSYLYIFIQTIGWFWVSR